MILDRIHSRLSDSVEPFFSSEEAQATTEYMLMLAVSLMIFLIFVRGFLQPWIQKVTGFLEDKIKNELFKPGQDSMHQLPFR